MKRLATVTALLSALLAIGCGDGAGVSTGAGAGGSAGTGGSAGGGCDPAAEATQTISCVASFTPGEDAGFGADRFPEIIYGPPLGKGLSAGSTDTISLGKGGEIVFGFGGNTIVDGDGPDLVIFENAFYVGGNPEHIFKELGEVSVSADGETWVTFPCKQDAAPFDGCAGWHPVVSSPESGVSPFDPAVSGGDPFDLADVGLASARLVRIRDVSNFGGGDNAGFDLDAAAIVHGSAAE